MTSEQDAQVEELFHAVIALAPAERAAFLAQTSGADEEVRRAVERLLRGHERAADFLDAPVWEAAALSGEPVGALIGQRLDHYQLLSLLGKGGMGEVYLARDERLERQVALKLLPVEFVQDAERVRRFEREAKAASALNHPNIITIYEIGKAEGVHFIVTEFVAGQTLRARMTEQQVAARLPLAQTLELAIQMASALTAAHAASIVHRDLKPENVMVRRDGLVKVLDFGLAKLTEPAAPKVKVDSEALTQSLRLRTEPGVVMGTVNYMSPEQARGQEVDTRSDLFSFGIVLYEMLAGRQPFVGASGGDVIAEILKTEPPPLAQAAPDTPRELERIVSRALCKDRQERYQTSAELLSDLKALKLQLDSGTRLVPATSGAEHLPSGFKRPRRAVLAALAVLSLAGALMLVLGFGVYRWFTPRLTAWPEAKFSPMIGLSGTKDYAAFSPDESRIAFAWDGGKNAQVSPHDIYVKVIGTDDNPLRLTDTPENELMPIWSPDGRYVTFLRAVADKREIYRVPAHGGKEQRLGETSFSCSWAPDGKTLAVTSLPAPGDQGSIFLLNLETGARTRLTTALPSGSDQFPVFSPDGQMVAFIRLRGMTESDVYVVPAGGGTAKRISFDDTRINGLTWTADSRELIYGANRGSKRQLFRVAAKGGAPERVPVTGDNPSWPTISRQGNKLAWTESLSDSNIYLYEGPGFAGHDVPSKFAAPRRIIGFPREDHSPEFSPDGQKLVFASGRAGGEDLWLCDADGGHPVRLTTQGGPTGTPHWSPDGQWLAFDSHTRGSGDIYVMPFAGGPWRALTNEPSAELQPAWSRDGQWIYFKSNRTGRPELWKTAAAGGAARQLTHNGAFEGFEAPDGKLFYFTKGRGVYGIWTIPVEGGEVQAVPELKAAGYWRSWGMVKEGIYFVTKEAAPRQTIKFFSFATRRITPLVTVEREPLWWQAGLALSPDGRRLVFAQMDYANDEIMLMENFR